MSYRDDRDADQARIAALETELSGAKQRIAALEGKQSQALVLTSRGDLERTKSAQRWLGAPLDLALERTFDGAFPTEKFEDLLGAMRQFTGQRGRSELLRSSMMWWSSTDDRQPGPVVSITVKDGKTTLRVTDKLTVIAGAWYGGLGIGLGAGGLVLPILATITMPVLAPVFFGTWLGGAYGFSRLGYKRHAKKRAQAVQRLFAELEKELAAQLGTQANAERTPVEQANAERTPLFEPETEKEPA